MSTYVFVESKIIDADKLVKYSQQAAATIAAHGGKFLMKGSSRPLLGEQSFDKKAVIEFMSAEDALNWYNSDEYQALVELRDQGMESRFQLVTTA